MPCRWNHLENHHVSLYFIRLTHITIGHFSEARADNSAFTYKTHNLTTNSLSMYFSDHYCQLISDFDVPLMSKHYIL